MPRLLILLATSALLSCFSNVADAQSLWRRRNEHFALFFVDTRAHNVGDQLTIVIAENTDVLKRDQRALDKSSDGSFNFNFAGASSGGRGVLCEREHGWRLLSSVSMVTRKCGWPKNSRTALQYVWCRCCPTAIWLFKDAVAVCCQTNSENCVCRALCGPSTSCRTTPCGRSLLRTWTFSMRVVVRNHISRTRAGPPGP